MAKTRVLVVDDSVTIRKRIVEVLAAEPDLEVVGEARDGKQAVELCQSLRPDVITLDMVMPVMSGAAVTEYVMAYCPTPILLVSASTNRGELYKTYDALAAGAVDVLEKPVGEQIDETWERKLTSTVKMVARIKVITHIRGKIGLHTPPHFVPTSAPVKHPAPSRVVAIGGSTGGPAAIVEILRGLPADFPIPILLVIHICASFSSSFGEWLDGQTKLHVRYGRDGEPLPQLGESGVIMAPPGLHLLVERGRLRLNSGPERNSCRPSIDVLFESLAIEYGDVTTACLLTGMGRDGAAGLLALRQTGAMTLAQDQSSCVVFGMPKAAIEVGAAERVLSLNRIAPALAELACGVESRSWT